MPNELEETHISNIVDLKDTGFGYTLSVIGGKYKIIILYWLLENEVMRFNELKRSILNISFKTLSVTLKEMEADGIVIRKEFPQIPPKVEYSLTDRGRSLISVIDTICEWGEMNSQR
ncbi:winged helix-turn-helix transcriptional regulator [Halalkalibacter hemicellulosilyticus]|uniref:Transcriptional regulator n=1 Tax=Halalkalibacter hemicellulosilyticusJCM 9152 TaxID=1236971 RepID=W4QK70_9BACI|nr:transcriptional regulator [Halalkalibacter hemicellulosilyticusJCM 9152]